MNAARSRALAKRGLGRRAVLAGAAGAALAGAAPAFGQAQFRGRELVSSSFGGPKSNPLRIALRMESA